MRSVARRARPRVGIGRLILACSRGILTGVCILTGGRRILPGIRVLAGHGVLRASLPRGRIPRGSGRGLRRRSLAGGILRRGAATISLARAVAAATAAAAGAGIHFGAILQFIRAVHYHLVAIVQAGGDYGAIALGEVGLDGLLDGFAIFRDIYKVVGEPR